MNDTPPHDGTAPLACCVGRWAYSSLSASAASRPPYSTSGSGRQRERRVDLCAPKAQEQPVNWRTSSRENSSDLRFPSNAKRASPPSSFAPTSRRGSMPHDRSRDVDGVPDTADRVAGVFLGQRVLLTVTPWRVNRPAQPCCIWLALADLFTSVDDGSSALLGRVEDQGPVPVFPHRAGPSW
jgi:hypothetical protein